MEVPHLHIFTCTLTAVLMVSLWSSGVHSRVVDTNNVSATATDDGGVNEEYDDGGNESDNWPVLCPQYTFFDQEEEKCMECSPCAINQVIVSPCQGLEDTKCGPFMTFHQFVSHSKKNNDDAQEHLESVDRHESFNSEENAFDDLDSKDISDEDRPLSSEVNNVTSHESDPSLILVTILIVVLLIFSVVFVGACYTCRVKRKSPNLIFKNATLIDYKDYKPAPGSATSAAAPVGVAV